ncbi:MAG: corrinoid protein [Clostridia bacterium]|nr:corrinoid protein [Clostridia bacterium]
MNTLDKIAQALIALKSVEVGSLVKAALEENISAEEILNSGLIKGMNEIGAQFKIGKIYVPQVMLAARAMYTGLDILNPILSEQNVEPAGIVAIGTVKGDMHDIGKNLVAMMMEGAGIKIIDLGTNVTADKFIDAIKNDGAQIVAMSALLTTTMQEMKTNIEQITNAGLRDQVKVMVGGAPITQEYADEIGADGYTADAGSAAEMAKEFLK